MNKYCEYECIRTKQGVKYFYCRFKRCKIERKECFSCNCLKRTNVCHNALKKQNKGMSIYKKRKPINKVSKHRITVSKKTYNIVYERDNGLCRLCGNYNIQLHHIKYRSEAPSLIDEPSNCIMLCYNCHNLVHSNKKKYQSMLLDIIKKLD